MGLPTSRLSCSQRLGAGYVLEASLFETFEALEAIRIDSRAVEQGAILRVRTGMIVLALKSGITFMRARPVAFPRFSAAARTRALDGF